MVYGLEAEQRMLGDPEICAPAGGTLKLCVDRSDEQRYSVFVRDDEPLAVEPISERGWWGWAAESPDGAAILASWTGYDCENSRAALIEDGRPRALTDGPSEALGWTTDGRPIVFVPRGCGAGEPGTYVDGTRVTERRLEPSLTPRDRDEIAQSP